MENLLKAYFVTFFLEIVILVYVFVCAGNNSSSWFFFQNTYNLRNNESWATSEATSHPGSYLRSRPQFRSGCGCVAATGDKILGMRFLLRPKKEFLKRNAIIYPRKSNRQRHFKLSKGIYTPVLGMRCWVTRTFYALIFYYIIAAEASGPEASEQGSRPNSCCGAIFQILSQRVALWLSSCRPCYDRVKLKFIPTLVKQHVYIVNMCLQTGNLLW